jgi:hypothetical protein
MTNESESSTADNAAASTQKSGEAAATEQPILTGAAKADDGAAGDKSAPEGSGDWKEYAPDASKTDEENARLKEEHDKTKPAEGKEGDKEKEASPEDTVPEDGKYDIKLEDGIQLDEALLEKAAPVMKEIGLTNAQASKLASVLAEQRKAEYDGLNERTQRVISDWQKEIRTDKDFGGQKLDANINNAERVIATFGDEAFRRDLKELGLGNHPGLFRLLARVGNALSDDKPITSETPAASRKSPEEAMYGATTPTTRG